MTMYRVIVRGQTEEEYLVEADSENEARDNWSDTEPVRSEVTDAYVESIVKVGDDDE